LAGKIVLSIGIDTKSDTDLLLAGELTPEDKERLDELHLRKIDLADEVLILNVDGYIGTSTKREIAYAQANGKVVRWLEKNDLQALLNWQRIHDWATAKPEGDELGQSCTNSQCPVALYLCEQTGRMWSVGPSIKIPGTSVRLEKPAWVNTLLNLVDTTERSVPITREQFLGLLDAVKS